MELNCDWVVSEEESGLTFQKFLQKKLEDRASLREIKKALELNHCHVNGSIERFGSTILISGDRVSASVATKHDTPSSAQRLRATAEKRDWSSRILYEDEFLLAINKPAGIPTCERGLYELLLSPFPELHVVHRLDRDTTGVLLFAKNHECADALKALFRQRQIQKQYLALVDGVPSLPQGKIINYLGAKHRYTGQTLWGEVDSSQGKLAVTVWKLEQSGKDCSVLRCYPETGRTHQLRVHLNGIGHPILGDFQYSKHFQCTRIVHRMMLHAERLQFVHPITGNAVEVEAKVPKDFLEQMVDIRRVKSSL